MSWVRLWSDMPTDPKWRVIAKRAGRPISEVLSVFMFMMTNAGERTERDAERGKLKNWSDEDVAAALDIETAAVCAIREAMQGKTLAGDSLTGWEKRQPKREDNSAERAKAWRERNRTQPNAEKRPDSDSEADSESLVDRPVQEPAREGFNGVDFLKGVRVGGGDPSVSAKAKREVCEALAITDAEPIVAKFIAWQSKMPPDKRAKASDGLFKSMAEKFHGQLTQAVRERIALPKPDPVVLPPVRPSSALAGSKLVTGVR